MGYGGAFVLRLGIGALLISAALISLGVKEFNRVKETRGGPRALALADLEAEGPETRGLVVLSEFLWCDESICVKRLGGGYENVIVPLYAAHLGEPPRPSQLRSLLRIFNIQDQQHLLGLFYREPFECQLRINGGALDSETKRVLADSYPGIDLDRCCVLDANARTPSASLASGTIALGVFLGVSGLIVVPWKAYEALQSWSTSLPEHVPAPLNAATPPALATGPGGKVF